MIGARISRQRVDQTDVRTFWGFNRTYTTVMGWVYVTHFKAGALTSQATWAQRGYTTLVCDLGKRVVLVHKLRQLAGAKKLFYGCGNGLGVNQILWHQPFAFRHRKALFNRTLNPYQTDTELVFCHL